MSESRVIIPTPEAKQAAERLTRHIAWSEGFWLGYVFTIDANQAEWLCRRLRGAFAEREAELRVLSPANPEELGLASILAQPSPAGVWVEAIREPDARGQAWVDAWMQLILRANERRELLREELGAGLVFVLHPGLKAHVRAAGPDLWSIRSIVFELPPGGEVGVIPLNPIRAAPVARFVDADLLDADLARWSSKIGSLSERERALTLVELARRLRDAGRLGQAAAFSKDALSSIRTLAGALQGHEESLAQALIEHAYDLARLGRVEDAFPLDREAVALYERGSRDLPEDELDYADALVQLGTHANVLGHYELADSTLREAIESFEDLLAYRPDDEIFLSGYASALDQLGQTLAHFGRFAEALDVATEASVIVSVLGPKDRDSFAPAAANVLTNRSTHLLAFGRRPEALTHLREVVGILRELADAHPGMYEVELGEALGNLARQLGPDADPDDPLVQALRTDLANCYEEIGRELPEDLAKLVSRSPDAEDEPLS